MKYFITVGERKLEVELVERLGELSVAVDGKPVEVSYREADQLGQVALVVEGRSYAVSIEGDRNHAAVTVAGHLYPVEIEDEREMAAHAAERGRRKSGGDVTSVMPGVVIQLLVAEGVDRDETDDERHDDVAAIAGALNRWLMSKRDSLSSRASDREGWLARERRTRSAFPPMLGSISDEGRSQ